jgi:exodeoxyribonuclease VII large subunit
MDSPATVASNIPEYSVSEIAGAIQATLRSRFARVRVRGEITECKRSSAGHVYLSLKDEEAKLEAVIWKSALRGLSVQPENGLEVVATGRIDTYADRPKYQLVIERLDYAGAGALLARIEALKKRLAAEGLFAPDRKRPLPRLPEVVGVVTSEQGAVIQDIRTTIARRFPRRILLWPVPVQGAGAAEQIAAAIAGFSALPPDGPIPRPDVLIIARGGGSLEDLMAFNEEVVVRAAAACTIPLISAVGHETDTTLIDFAADRRAPTPTAAAELAVPSRAELLAAVAQQGARLMKAGEALLTRARLRLSRAESGLPDAPGLLARARQRLDDRSERLAAAPAAILSAARLRLARVAARLPDMAASLALLRQRLSALAARLAAAPAALLAARRAALSAAGHRLPAPQAAIATARGALRLAAERLRSGFAGLVAGRARALSAARLPAPDLAVARVRLEGLSARLEGASYAAVLARGFVLVRDAAGHPLTRAAEVKPGQAMSLRFADGEVPAIAAGGRGGGRRPSLPPGQESLL